MVFASANTKAVIMKVVVSTLLLIGIIVAILKLFVWFINYSTFDFSIR